MFTRRLVPILSLVITTLSYATVPSVKGASGLTVSWTNNLLTITGPNLPGGSMSIWYLEAFCRSGSTKRDWGQTVLPHKTSLLSSTRDGKRLQFSTKVTPSVEVLHEVRAGKDELEFEFKLTNKGTEFVDLNWGSPLF